MIQICPHCRLRYDDNRRSTSCPHPMLMSERDLARKDDALKLIGKRVRVIAEGEGAIPLLINVINYTGWITLYGRDREYEPSELEEVTEL